MQKDPIVNEYEKVKVESIYKSLSSPNHYIIRFSMKYKHVISSYELHVESEDIIHELEEFIENETSTSKNKTSALIGRAHDVLASITLNMINDTHFRITVKRHDSDQEVIVKLNVELTSLTELIEKIK